MARKDSLDAIRKILEFVEEGMSPVKIQAELQAKFGIDMNQNNIVNLLSSQPSLFFQLEGKWKVKMD